jgi:uncharacterized cupredoxin-like copper-binding protein
MQSLGRLGGIALLLITLLLFAALPAWAVDWTQAQTVTVVTSDYQFSPNELTFRRGVPYRLHLQNRGRETHEFTAPDFIKSARIRNPKVLNADQTEVVVQPGQAKDFYFVPKTAGRFSLICGDHDWAGMTGGITVE